MWARTMRKPTIRRKRWVERWREERIAVVVFVDQAEREEEATQLRSEKIQLRETGKQVKTRRWKVTMKVLIVQAVQTMRVR